MSYATESHRGGRFSFRLFIWWVRLELNQLAKWPGVYSASRFPETNPGPRNDEGRQVFTRAAVAQSHDTAAYFMGLTSKRSMVFGPAAWWYQEP